MKKSLIAIGIIALVVAGAWKFGYSPRYDVRMPDGWRWQAATLAVIAYPDANGEFPAGTTINDDPLSVAEREVSISREGAPAGLVMVTDHYAYRDAVTGAVQWELSNTAIVDPQTGKHGTPEYAEDHYVFPRHTEQTTYAIRHNYLQGLPVTYERTEDVLGLQTYVFSHKGDFDDTGSWPDEPLAENEAIICPQGEIAFWVEPVTGEIVKFREWCPEGEYVTNTVTGERGRLISRWTSQTSGDGELLRVAEVRSQMNTYNMMTFYIPALLALLGVILIGFGIASNFMNNAANSKKVITG
jgi:hypothetical protein